MNKHDRTTICKSNSGFSSCSGVVALANPAKSTDLTIYFLCSFGYFVTGQETALKSATTLTFNVGCNYREQDVQDRLIINGKN